jgi:hypothetical protein
MSVFKTLAGDSRLRQNIGTTLLNLQSLEKPGSTCGRSFLSEVAGLLVFARALLDVELPTAGKGGGVVWPVVLAKNNSVGIAGTLCNDAVVSATASLASIVDPSRSVSESTEWTSSVSTHSSILFC